MIEKVKLLNFFSDLATHESVRDCYYQYKNFVVMNVHMVQKELFYYFNWMRCCTEKL